MLRIDLDRRWRVSLRARIPSPLPVEPLWARIADLETFATRDPFHRRFRVRGPVAVGSPVTITHGLPGTPGFDRIGRILRWEEGRVCAFSDLSRRDPARGFPHIYRYEIVEEGDGACHLRFEVIGRWTARWIPRPIVRLWLGSVMELAALRLAIELRRGTSPESEPGTP